MKLRGKVLFLKREDAVRKKISLWIIFDANGTP